MAESVLMGAALGGGSAMLTGNDPLKGAAIGGAMGERGEGLRILSAERRFLGWAWRRGARGERGEGLRGVIAERRCKR